VRTRTGFAITALGGRSSFAGDPGLFLVLLPFESSSLIDIGMGLPQIALLLIGHAAADPLQRPKPSRKVKGK